MAELLPLLLAALGAGAAAGLLAGLLGVGGGLVIVPVLLEALARQGWPGEHLMHVALGTSLASIVFTSLASARAHHRRGAVDWAVVRSIAPGVVAGTLAGAALAAGVRTAALRTFFGLFVAFVGLQMLLDARPRSRRALPGAVGTGAAGLAIGALSSLAGIGGGSLSVPFLTWCGATVHRAVGTSAAIGFPIAVAGTAGYVTAGLGAELPGPTLGYVSLPALLGVLAASVPTAPLGARLAHALPVSGLRRVFAATLLLVAARMLLRGPA